MALAASPPPPSTSHSLDVSMSDALDEEIAQVRAEIQSLTSRRTLLTSSLLSSTKVQSHVSNLDSTTTATNTTPLGDDLNPLLQSTHQHCEQNTHRLALGVTSFPFHDPSPELQSKNPLLGIRFDICARSGRYDSPYYIFCIKAGDGQELRIHRHTIPALVPLEQYERQYLPQSTSASDEGYGGSEDSLLSNDRTTGIQDLHGLVARVRHDLVSWRLRRDVVDYVREEGLRIPESRTAGSKCENVENRDLKRTTEDESEDSDEDLDDEPVGQYSVRSFTALDVDARLFRIVWSDDRVARLRISDDGRIEKAVVIGLDGQRIRDVERILSGGGASVYDLEARLEQVWRKTSGITEVTGGEKTKRGRLRKGAS